MLRRSSLSLLSIPNKTNIKSNRPHTKIIIWGTFGSVPARRNKPTELIITNLPPQDEFPSWWNFIACAAGSRHIALLTQEGHIVLVGSNKHGQLGMDTSQTIPENEPQFFDLDFRNPEKEKPNALACGCNYTIAYRRAATVVAPSSSDLKKNDQNDDESGIRAVVIGYNHAGQLGLGHKEILDNRDGIAEWKPNANWWNHGLLPDHENSSSSSSSSSKIAHITCGYNHSFAVMTDGRVFGFGTNQWGELGLGRNITDSPMHPTLLPFFDPTSDFVLEHQNERKSPQEEQREQRAYRALKKRKPFRLSDIRAGNSFSLFLGDEGRVFACGTGGKGQLPFATQEPTVYPIQRDARPVLMRCCNISCGGDHMVIVTRTKNKQKEEELFERREKLLQEWKKRRRSKSENDETKQQQQKEVDDDNYEDEESHRFFHDLLEGDSKNLYHDYEVFFRGSMPDIGIVNATGNFQKVELGTAQPPFQYITSHASSTILIDKNGDFYGLGANSEGQLGDWGLIGNMSHQLTSITPATREAELNEKRLSEQEIVAKKVESKKKAELQRLREKEIELFGEDVVSAVDREIENKKTEKKSDDGNDDDADTDNSGSNRRENSSNQKLHQSDAPLVAPEGFGIVYSESTPSAFNLHSTRFQSREMPLLAVEELKDVVGLRRRKRTKHHQHMTIKDNNSSAVLDSIRTKQEGSKTTRFDWKCFIGERRLKNNDNTSNASSADEKDKNNHQNKGVDDADCGVAVIPEWRDRVALGNGFGVLLDPNDEYRVGGRDVIDDDNDSAEDDDDDHEDENICYMPPIEKSSKTRRTSQLSQALSGGKKKKKKKKNVDKILSGSNRKFW